MESKTGVKLWKASSGKVIGVLAALQEALIGPHPRIKSEEKRQQARLLSQLLLGLIVTGGIIIPSALRLDPNDINSPLLQGGIVVVAFAMVMYITNRLGYTLAAAFGLTTVFGGIFLYISFFVDSPNAESLAFLLIPILLAGLFFPLRAMIATSVLMLAAAFLLNNADGQQVPAFWAHRTLLYFLALATVLLITFIVHLSKLERLRRAALEDANIRLRESETLLEQRVLARTRDLKVASDAARQMTTVLDLGVLLPQLVALTRQSFDLYAVSLFLFSPDMGQLNLVASTGDAGRRMLESGRIFHIDEARGLVSQAARSRSSIVINDVQVNSDHLINPYLPETCSEIAVPMLVGNRLVGVLDLQSAAVNRFGTEDVEIMTTLAEQMAIAIRNAQLFAEAEAARAAAEEANEVKSRFLANMSHELRTPLNAILNFTAFVADGVLGPVSAEQADVLNQSLGSGKHLLSLINDVLDITKIEAGMMQLFIQEVDFNEALAGTVSVARGLIKEKPIALMTEIEENLPTSFGDKRRLRQVFLNLISNAIKFTQEGSVTIEAKRSGDGIRVRVSDTGIGIGPEDHALVFESFRQVNKHEMVEAIAGTGLGMPISKYFVESHGGQVWFESEPGVGTTFYVQLPVLTREEAIALNAPAEPVKEQVS